MPLSPSCNRCKIHDCNTVFILQNRFLDRRHIDFNFVEGKKHNEATRKPTSLPVVQVRRLGSEHLLKVRVIRIKRIQHNQVYARRVGGLVGSARDPVFKNAVQVAHGGVGVVQHLHGVVGRGEAGAQPLREHRRVVPLTMEQSEKRWDEYNEISKSTTNTQTRNTGIGYFIRQS